VRLDRRSGLGFVVVLIGWGIEAFAFFLGVKGPVGREIAVADDSTG
jgi:hypothetical protein